MIHPVVGKAISLRGHTVFELPKGSAPFVVDCGAHLGEFSQAAVERWGARAAAIEPSPELFPRIGDHPNIRKYAFAVTDSDGETEFGIAANPEASRTGHAVAGVRTVKVPTMSLESFFKNNDISEVDILKLDIEGAEIAVIDALSDATLARIVQITVEFHDFCNLVSLREIYGVMSKLKNLGFHVFRFSRKNYSDVLFVNGNFSRIGLMKRLYVENIVYLQMGVRRVLARSMML